MSANKYTKAIQRNLSKQKREIIAPKLEWLMRSSCTFHLSSVIEIRLINWEDPITQYLVFEFVIVVLNHRNTYIEII